MLQCDVFPEESLLSLGDVLNESGSYVPDQVAVAAWSEVCDWVTNGYFPVVTVLMPDGSEHTIDVEEVLRRREHDQH
jgi:hypothetical protein